MSKNRPRNHHHSERPPQIVADEPTTPKAPATPEQPTGDMVQQTEPVSNITDDDDEVFKDEPEDIVQVGVATPEQLDQIAGEAIQGYCILTDYDDELHGMFVGRVVTREEILAIENESKKASGAQFVTINKRPSVRAVCPQNPSHRAVVYKTTGRVRYCKCTHDGCTQKNWKIDGPMASLDPSAIDPNIISICPRNSQHRTSPYKQRGPFVFFACDDCDVPPWIVTVDHVGIKAMQDKIQQVLRDKVELLKQSRNR